ncbi:YwiC-like family protein [Bifidobacterium sp. ESL0690]|uniref:YwiC-like family protein n=1 Tax=Bifidobacterium sp. ESL0690 TaxID=2983214 RepID=UPI0023F98E4D|nr:YwiC-like family protein [Bifidobacterium sp. ESL0690]WEV46945.1 YwiC-like family protein [Bifidobacterium sp. ESL0690]
MEETKTEFLVAKNKSGKITSNDTGTGARPDNDAGAGPQPSNDAGVNFQPSNHTEAQSRINAKTRHTKHTNIWLPDQPGAWVMALFPALGGIVIGGISWRNVWLLLAWTLCYCFQFSAARWLAVRSHEVKDARKRRRGIGHSGKMNTPNPMASNSSSGNLAAKQASASSTNSRILGLTSSSASASRTARTVTSTKKRHSNIYFVPAAAYFIATAIVGIPVFVFAPKLLWWIPAYAVLATLSFVAAWLRRERTLWGNAVAVIAAGGMALLATSLGSRFFVAATPNESLASRLSPLLPSHNTFAAGSNGVSTALHQGNPLSVSRSIDATQYFLGSPLLPKAGVIAAVAFVLTEYASVVFVKTMFRKYGNSGYYGLSIIYHVVLAVLGFGAPTLLQNLAGFTPARGVTAATLLWGVAATVLLLIAIIFPHHKRMKAMQVGGIEAFTSLMNLVVIAVALA